EGARGDPGGLGDVDDARVQEPVTLEHLLGGLDEAGARPETLPRALRSAAVVGRTWKSPGNVRHAAFLSSGRADSGPRYLLSVPATAIASIGYSVRIRIRY